MATNITLTTFDNCAVVYFDDGTSTVVEPNQEYFLQLADMGFCTISEAADPDAAEHPPPEFAEAMVAFWQAWVKTLKAMLGGPEVNPL